MDCKTRSSSPPACPDLLAGRKKYRLPACQRQVVIEYPLEPYPGIFKGRPMAARHSEPDLISEDIYGEIAAGSATSSVSNHCIRRLMMEIQFKKLGLPMTGVGMNAACENLGVAEPEIWAVLTVETRGFGFLKDRRPQILFERHIFSQRTGHRFDAHHPDISGRQPGGYEGGADEYTRLEKAVSLDQQAALQSASWGLSQVMGFNFKIAGYANVEDMVKAIVEGEDAHLESLANFIRSNNKCLTAIRRRDWGSFAACYNGPAFRKNEYDSRLAAAYQKSKAMLPDIGLRRVQVALTYLGYKPGPIDGFRGRMTRGAVGDFQAREGLPVTGELDDRTEDKLFAKAFPG